MSEVIYFSKVKPEAIIPSKRVEDGAYDLYPCFEEYFTVIEPFTSKLIPTGIASAFSDDYAAVFRERGSTGIKNVKINAGVIDSGYRGEWFVCIYNANDKPLVILKSSLREINEVGYVHFSEDKYIVYPYNKAIAQFLFVPVPKLEIQEMPYDEIKRLASERGMGSLGSSKK